MSSMCTVHDSTLEGRCGCGWHHFPRPAVRSVWDRWADAHPDAVLALREEAELIEELGDA